MNIRKIIAADLFCGAGGTSEGIRRACEQMGIEFDLVAINHWDLAISSHTANFPEAMHRCENLEALDPRQVVPGGRLHLLCASPECTHHSNARGGMPMNDQSRASAYCILRWASVLYVDNIIIENVPEFQSWGPLGANGRPMPGKKGKLFLNFVKSLRAIGYKVEWKVLNSADYGDPQTRKRLFLLARRGGKPIIWPEPTHISTKVVAGGLFEETRLPWVPARAIIDWTLEGKSIFGRKKPLAQRTLERIYRGFEKFGGPNAGPYLVVLRRHMDGQSLDDPVPCVTASGTHLALCQPALIGMGGPEGSAKPQSVDVPCGTVLVENHRAVVEPIILNHDQFHRQCVQPISEPRATITAVNGRGNKIVEPFILAHEQFGQDLIDSIDDPLRTVKANNGNDTQLVDAVMIPRLNERDGQLPRCHSMDEPMPTVTASNSPMLAASHLIQYNGASEAQSVDDPLCTVTTKDRFAVAESFLVDVNHGDGDSRRSQSIDHPMATVTGSRGKGLIQSELPAPNYDHLPRVVMPDGKIYPIDIRIRMLRPHELAAAQSIGNLTFNGTLEQQVKQIGNAVPAETARNLVQAMIA